LIYAQNEQRITSTLQSERPRTLICGPFEGVWPAWHLGLRYLTTRSDGVFGSREQEERYIRLVQEQALFEISNDGQVVRRPPQP
jgi:hypothetical protein